MTTQTPIQFFYSLWPQETLELARLARRYSTTPAFVAAETVCRMLWADQAGTPPKLPSFDFTDPTIEPLYEAPRNFIRLKPDEMEALDVLAARLDMTPANLCRIAVSQMLADVRAGATPMITPLKPEDSKLDPALLLIESEKSRAECNFAKAWLMFEALDIMIEFGFTEKSLDLLRRTDDLRTFKP